MTVEIPRNAVIDLRDGRVTIDGIKFPYPITTNSISVRAISRSHAEITLTIPVGTVAVFSSFGDAPDGD